MVQVCTIRYTINRSDITANIIDIASPNTLEDSLITEWNAGSYTLDIDAIIERDECYI